MWLILLASLAHQDTPRPRKQCRRDGGPCPIAGCYPDCAAADSVDLPPDPVEELLGQRAAPEPA